LRVSSSRAVRAGRRLPRPHCGQVTVEITPAPLDTRKAEDRFLARHIRDRRSRDRRGGEAAVPDQLCRDSLADCTDASGLGEHRHVRMSVQIDESWTDHAVGDIDELVRVNLVGYPAAEHLSDTGIAYQNPTRECAATVAVVDPRAGQQQVHWRPIATVNSPRAIRRARSRR
jgi:hypothetical protein